MSNYDGPEDFLPDCGRQIPPPLNPDFATMIDRVQSCYVALGGWIAGFQEEIVALVDAGKLDPAARAELSGHYRNLRQAVDAAIRDFPERFSGTRVDDFIEASDRIPDVVHRFADHAKHVYAVGTRDIAALQYGLAELAHTGRLDFKEHERLQWDHCLPIWEMLYLGTASAVCDQRIWDGAWTWCGNTYSSGRQIMVQARIKNWMEVDRDWPYNAGMCGDGPIMEHPRGSLCQIFPVVDPHNGFYYDHPSVEIDLDGLIEQLGLLPSGRGTKPEPAAGGQ